MHQIARRLAVPVTLAIHLWGAPAGAGYISLTSTAPASFTFGGDGRLVVSAPISECSSFGTPKNDGVHMAITSGIMSIDLGPPAPGGSLANGYFYFDGGNVAITGGFAGGLAESLIAGPPLKGVHMLPTPVFGPGGLAIAAAPFFAPAALDMVHAYGGERAVVSSFTGIFFGTPGSSGMTNGGAFEVRIDIAGPAATPEPASVLMVGLGLAGMGVWRMRRA